MSQENEIINNQNPDLQNQQIENQVNKSLKDKMTIIGEAIYTAWLNDKDKVDEMKECHKMLQDILNKCENVEEIENYFNNDNEDFNFFITKFSKKVVPNILKQGVVYGENGEEIAFDILIDYLKIFLKYILSTTDENNYKLFPMFESIKEIFDNTKSYYKSNASSREKNPNSKKFIPVEEFNELFLKKKNNINISEINEGEEIDVLVQIQERNYETKGWLRGKIISKDNNEFLVEVLNQNGLIKFNINSFLYAPKGTFTKDWEWRINLKEGDIIDCYERSKYYPATIGCRKEGENKLIYHVIFRIYLDSVNNDIQKYKKFWPEKDIEEEDGRKFIGDDKFYEEDILATSRRLNMKDTKLTNNEVNINEDEEHFYIDDQIEDFYLNGKKTITIGRYINYEYYYNLMLIEFGNLNCFDIMLNYINNLKNENDKKVDNSEIVLFIFVFFKIVFGYLYKPLIKELSQKLYKCFLDYVNNLSVNDLRNIKKETSDLMSEVLKLYSNVNGFNNEDKNNKYLIEIFSLNFAIKMLKTNFLDKRTTSIKSISDLIKIHKNDDDFKKILIDIIKNNNIIYEIYGPNSHVQLVSKSKELIEILLTNDKLSEDELSLIWNATKTGDLDEKRMVLKILNDIISSNLNTDEKHIKPVIIKILNSIQKENSNINSEMSEEEIELIFNLINELNDNEIIGNYLDKFIEFIKENKQSKYVNNIIRKIYEISIKQSLIKIKVVNQALEFIQNEKYLSIGYRILSLYLNKSNLMIDEDLNKLIIENNNLLNIYKKSFEDYYSNKEKIDKNQHEKIVKNRIEFLNNLIKNNIWNIDGESPIDFVYRFLVLNKYNENDEKCFYKWLQSLIKKERKLIGIEEKIFKLFTDKSNNLTNHLSIEGFETFLQVFIEMNENENRINIEKDNQNNIIIKSEINPKNLKGFSELKKIIFENNNNEIIDKGIKLLNNLYMNNRQSLVDLCLEEIKNSNNNSEIVNKCISILTNLMYLNEENGTAGVTSHLSTIKSELISIICYINLPYNINTQTRIINIYSNSTFYNFKTQISNLLNYHHDFMKFELIINSNNENDKLSNTFNLRTNLLNNNKVNNNNRMELNNHDNGKTLNELNIKNKSQFYITSNQLERQIIDKDILDSQNNVIDEVVKIFNDWFDYYSSNNKMSAKDLAHFVKDVTNAKDEITVEDSRVTKLMNEKNKNHDGYIERDEFVNWYKDSAINRPKLVLENIKATGYRGDLKKINEGYYEENKDKNSMLRYILGNNDSLIKALFDIMKENYDKVDIFNFAIGLSTNCNIYNQIVGIKDLINVDWDNLIMNGNIYYFCYVCIIIQYIIENGNKFNEFKEWIKIFILSDGYKFIIDTFIKELKKITEKNDNNNIDFICFELLTKIIKLIYINSIESINDNEELFKYLNNENLTKKINDIFTNKEMFSSLIIIIDISIKKKFDNNIINEIIQLIIILIPNIEDTSNDDKLIDLILNGLNSEKDETRLSFENALIRMCNILISKEKYNIISKLFEKIENNMSNKDKINNSICNCFIYLLCTYNDKNDKFVLNNNFDLNSFSQKINNEINDELTINFKQPKLTDEQLSSYLRILAKLIEINENIKKEINEKSQIFENILFKIIFYSDENEENEKKKEDSLKNKLTDKIIEIEDSEKMEFINIDTIKKKKIINRALNIEILNSSYLLILVLLKDNFKNFKLYFSIEESISKKNSQINEIDTSKQYRTCFEKRKFDYVGLKNLGCICYMNSTMQQFYMTPTLRYTVLKLNDNQKRNFINSERNRGNEKIDDNMFHQLQKLFSYLLLSERVDYDPFGFTYSFKDFDGNPTKLYEQKDTQEFLAIFLDRLEQSSKSSEYKNMISNIFGGKNCSLITCLECGNVSYRYEPSVFLSLEVKNMKNLNDSLDKYITEEHIDGYECDGCKKKCRISKRNILASLPNVLIIHLQRIFYNWEIDHNEKINSRLEFSKKINLKNYTIENILKDKENKGDDIYFRSDEYYNYYLVGVVVHVGSADSGHYYSYINTIRDGNGNISYFNSNDDNVNSSWLEFNDSSISKFDISRLEEETFGGSLNDDNDNSNQGNFMNNGRNGMFNFRREKCKNAYLLVYERLVKSPNILNILNYDKIQNKKENIIEFNENDENKIFKEYDMMRYYNKDNLNEYENKCEELYKKVFHNLKNNEYFKFEPFYNYNNKRLVPKIYYDEIEKDNKNFEKIKNISESQYSSFFSYIIDLLEVTTINNIDKINSDDAEKISNTFVNYILSNIQNKTNKENLSNGCKKLINVVETNKELFKNPITKLLEENTEKFKELLRFESSDVSKEINDLNDKIKSIIEENNVDKENQKKFLNENKNNGNTDNYNNINETNNNGNINNNNINETNINGNTDNYININENNNKGNIDKNNFDENNNNGNIDNDETNNINNDESEKNNINNNENENNENAINLHNEDEEEKQKESNEIK